MNTKLIIGIILIIVGIIAFSFQGINYTTREKAIDIGPLQITEERTHNFPLPPLIGVIAIATGAFLLFTNKFAK